MTPIPHPYLEAHGMREEAQFLLDVNEENVATAELHVLGKALQWMERIGNLRL